MKSLIKKIAHSDIGLSFRNTFNVKPMPININNSKSVSVSDSFIWRTDSNFRTKFKYTDILNLFYKTKNTWVEFHFYTKENRLIKIEKYKNLDISNEIEINSKFLGDIEDYGTFYIYHYSEKEIEGENIISNRCYLGYSQDQKLFSFVHGNVYAKSSEIYGNQKISSNILKTSLFKNKYYKIQKYFDNYDRSELIFANPTSKTIRFSINNCNYQIKPGCSRLVDISDIKIINIKSNCLLLRPTVFSYKESFLDVHHS